MSHHAVERNHKADAVCTSLDDPGLGRYKAVADVALSHCHHPPSTRRVVKEDRDTGERVLVTLFPKRVKGHFYQTPPTYADTAMRQVLAWRDMDPAYIVGFRRVLLTATSLGIAEEHMAGGKLLDAISGRAMPEVEARHLFRQLIGVLAYCRRKVGWTTPPPLFPPGAPNPINSQGD